MSDLEIVVGTRVPRSLMLNIGVFLVCFSALDAELNHLIRHVARVSEPAGKALVAASPGAEVRAQLLEALAIANVKNKKNRGKILKLAREFRRVAEYHHALLHHEFLDYVPPGKTVAVPLKSLTARPMPVELSRAWLIYQSNFSGHLAGRMNEYRTGDPRWTDDKHFPWHGEPMTDPETVPHLSRGSRQI